MPEQRVQTIKIVWQGDDAKRKVVEMTRALSDTDAAVEALTDAFGDSATVTAKVTRTQRELAAEARRVIREQEREAAATKRQRDAADNYIQALRQQVAIQSMTADQAEIYAAKMRLGANATEQQTREVEELVVQLQRQRAATQNTSGSMRNMRGVAQNLGWQLQDTIVQLQMGTSAMVVLSQQGSQFAAAFGPTGAVVGAVIALAGALGGALIPQLLNTGDNVESLIDKLERLNDAYRLTAEEALFLSAKEQETIDSIREQNESIKSQIQEYTVLRDEMQRVINRRTDLGYATGENTEKLEQYNAKLREARAELSINERQLRTSEARLKMFDLATKESGETLDQWANYSIYGMGVGMQEAEKQLQELTDEVNTTSDAISNVPLDLWSNYSLYGSGVGMQQATQQLQEMQDAVNMDLETRTQQLQFQLDPDMAALDTVLNQNELLSQALDKRLINQKEFENLSKESWNAYYDSVAEQTRTQTQSSLQVWGTFLSGLNNITGQLAGIAEEGSAEARALFYTNQAIAFANAIVSAEQAAAQALTLGPILGIPASSLVRGLGYASAGVIAGTTIAGAFNEGGRIPAGQVGITSEYSDELVNGVLVRGPARVTSAAETADIINNGGGEVTDINITVVNNASGVSHRVERMSENDVRIIAEEVFNHNLDKGVASVLDKPSSKASKSMANNFNTRRIV